MLASMMHWGGPMRVVLISHAYPPDPEVGSLRGAKVAAALAAAGHDVEVVTNRLAGETQAIRAAGRGMTVHAVRSIPHPRRAYLRVKHWFGRNGSAPSGRTEVAPPSPSTWKRYLLSLLWLPDEYLGFLPAALWACWKIHRRGGVDLLYTTAPPFSSHLAGLAFKAMTGVPWAAEFRDPWTDNPAKPARLRTRFTDAVERWLERLCLRNADHVVSVTDAIHELLATKLPARARARFVVARNGIDRLLPSHRSADARAPFRIVHAGSLYHGRDPRAFLRALAALRRQGKFADGDVQVELVGDARWFDDVSIERFVQDLGIAPLVQFRDWLSHDACLEIVQRADLLLLFAQHQPAQVPNKLFEYLGTRKPILAFADAQGEVAGMLRRVGGHYVVVEDEPAAAEAALASALNDARAAERETGDEAVLREWTTERQMGRLLTALHA
jgi:glycosyltransferase involved in cell wall biosynthesis